ncbi:response regulator [Sulfuricurvum sp.]|uniref:response regulator transcription factor n=1 Tax=Sulfuricurvum sp. TaxID=2025608 RepID=UPI002D2ABEC4|nr:response regulator [Sulfuricurvum sp.]HZF69873.1 response regulator [Sulfuricurvum sp.]
MIKTILIAEDDRESNDYLTLFLGKKCQQVLSAYDGQEAWRLYEEYMPDLIFTDIEMPKLDGLKLIEKIRQHDQTTPIVILSAYSDIQYLLQAIPLQLEEYILKPITFDKVDSFLKKMNTKEIKKHSTKVVINKAKETFYDYASKTARIGEHSIPLTNLEITLLELLLDNQRETVSYSEMEEILYGKALNNHNAIKCLVKNLRAKIPTMTIRSIPKIGYSLS